VGADLPLETEKNVAEYHVGTLDAVETELDLKSEIYKKLSRKRIWGSAASYAGAVLNQ
jgi:hypothetical protein